MIQDHTDNGGTLKRLTLIDEPTRQGLAIRPARKLTRQDVLEVVKETVRPSGASDDLCRDNSREFIARIMQDWFREYRIKTIYRRTGQPVAERLDRKLLLNLREARVGLENLRLHDNENRPHSKLWLPQSQPVDQKTSFKPGLRSAYGLAPSGLEQTEDIS